MTYARGHNCNLLRDGVERATKHVRQVTKHSRGLMSWVVRPCGKMRAYRRGVVPEHDEPNLLGTYNAKISEATLVEDLELRLAEITA